MESHSVEIIDDQTGITYAINLTTEAHEKAMTDPSYVNTLLAVAKGGTLPSTSSTADQPIVEESENTSSAEEPIDTWTTEGTLNFISEYEKLQDHIDKGKIKQKDAFEKISRHLRDKNININAKQCATKLASLKRTYKKIKGHNQKYGDDRQTWQYFERMESIFSKKPWINPVALCSSRSDTNELIEDISEEVPASQSKRKRRISSTDDILNEVLVETKKRQKDRARQHAEKMERLDKLLAILQQNSGT